MKNLEVENKMVTIPMKALIEADRIAREGHKDVSVLGLEESVRIMEGVLKSVRRFEDECNACKPYISKADYEAEQRRKEQYK